MQLIHLGTRVSAQFGVLDDEGDLRRVVPVDLELIKLSKQGWEDLIAHLDSERLKLIYSLLELSQAIEQEPNPDGS